MSSAKLNVNSEWLVWARKTARYKPEDVAKKIKTSKETINEWEKTGLIEYENLEKLAEIYKRSTNVFFSASKPKYEKNEADFRTVGSVKNNWNSEIAFELRSAKNRRENLISLEEEFDDYIFKNFKFTSLSKNPSEIALLIRQKIGMSKASIDSMKNQNKALNHWIRKIEELGVLVFQFYNIPPEEMRGYALFKKKLPIIGINSREHVNGKKFTLFHELAHLIVKKGGISNFNKFNLKNEDEIFCNQIATEVLVPTTTFEQKLRDYKNVKIWEDYQINSLSKYFKVSNEVVIRRLLSLNKISKSYYNQKNDEWTKKYVAQKSRTSIPKNKVEKNDKTQKPQDIINITQNAKAASKSIRENGIYYTELVLEAYDSKLITNSVMADYLGVNLQIISEIRKKLSEGV